MAVEARRHQEGHYVHIYRAREGPGETRGCRNGAVGTWKLLYNGDREEKRHKDKDPKPCRQNTACAAQQSRGRPHQAGDATPPPRGPAGGAVSLPRTQGPSGRHSAPPRGQQQVQSPPHPQGPGRRRHLPQAAALRSCEGGRQWRAILSPPPAGGSGQTALPHSPRERGGAYKTGVLNGIPLQGLCF